MGMRSMANALSSDRMGIKRFKTGKNLKCLASSAWESCGSMWALSSVGSNPIIFSHESICDSDFHSLGPGKKVSCPCFPTFWAHCHCSLASRAVRYALFLGKWHLLSADINVRGERKRKKTWVKVSALASGSEHSGDSFLWRSFVRSHAVLAACSGTCLYLPSAKQLLTCAKHTWVKEVAEGKKEKKKKQAGSRARPHVPRRHAEGGWCGRVSHGNCNSGF